MYQPLAPIARGREVTQTVQIPASIKGWIQNQAIARQDPETAYQLENWFPEAQALRLRLGSQKWANINVNTPVETVMSYLTGAGSKVFAATNNRVYDVTLGGNVSVAAKSGLLSTQLSWINFANAGGNWLICCNGFDPPFAYNGTSFVNLAITGPSSVNLLDRVWEYAGTLFFIEANSTRVWYLAPGAVQGAANSIDFGSLMDLGGQMKVGAEWTYTSPNQIQSTCAFITSEGEVLVFMGSSPASSSTWAMQGRFKIGRPIGERCVLKTNSDLIVLCEDGVIGLSKAMEFDRADAAQAALTWNIQDAFNEAYLSAGQYFGWQIFTHPLKHQVMVNVPQVAGASSVQYVQNMITGAWCKFSGQNAASWCLQGDVLYFGGFKGDVWIGATGSADDVNPISATWVSAFSDLGAPGRYKSARAIRCVFQGDSNVTPQMGVCCDYNVQTPPALATQVTPINAVWDTALWDAAVWGSGTGTWSPWGSAVGEGYQLAAIVAVNVKGTVPTSPITIKIVTAYVLFEAGTWLG